MYTVQVGTHVHGSVSPGSPGSPVPGYPWGLHVRPRRSTSRPVPRELVMSASCSLSSLASGPALSSLSPMTLCYSWFSLCGKLLSSAACHNALCQTGLCYSATARPRVSWPAARLICGDVIGQFPAPPTYCCKDYVHAQSGKHC